MSAIDPGYVELLAGLKNRIRIGRVRAALAANAELIGMYWDLGRMIVERQAAAGWGKSVVDHLSEDLRAEFPFQQGLSGRNLWLMRQFYMEWSQSFTILQRSIAELGIVKQDSHNADILQVISAIPWGQNIDLVSRVKDPVQRFWYARQTVENGWSRPVLAVQIETDLYSRQGAALTNFKRALPPPGSDLAQQIFKDRYLLDFVVGGPEMLERELEEQLTTRITRFLLELGKGFAFVGRQFRISVGEDDFFIDMLFYHIHLHSYIAVELKTGRFEPEYTGKMNFYLEVLDRQVRRSQDGPSIGLILCRT